MDIKVTNVSFRGMATRLPVRRIFSAQDAIAQWEQLRHPKYTNIFQETEDPTSLQMALNKEIRESNYSFLDELKSTANKSEFIAYFREKTGFPNLRAISKRMVKEFNRVLAVASKRVGQSDDDTFLKGYDKFCSVGLGTALPGSDIDKAYAIIKGVNGGMVSQQEHSARFKDAIWENIDNRIMSVNHCAAFPNIMTEKELDLSLDKFDSFSQGLVDKDTYYKFLNERLSNPSLISGAKFNIWLSERLPNNATKEEAKNLAYVIEAIRDGAREYYFEPYMAYLTNRMNQSAFSWCSNITQAHQMTNKYDYSQKDVIKPKLKARRELERGFDDLNTNKQYELVKDVIRSMSGDNKNPEFEQLFRAKEDKHRLLLNDILRGKVECAFEFLPNGRERTHIKLQGQTAAKYYDVDVYKSDY
ncbi:hypothetical protein J6Q66_07140 [bacterium]|nr:hypothetical protein [bacterium]